MRPVILEPMRVVRSRLAELSEWTKEGIADAIDQVASECDINMGKLGQPVRVAVTGGPVSPPIDATVYLVGRDRTMARLDEAIRRIELRVAATSG